LTTYWSESTLSSRWFGGPASRHGSSNPLFQDHSSMVRRVLAAVEGTWHTRDSQGQILPPSFRYKSPKRFDLLHLRCPFGSLRSPPKSAAHRKKVESGTPHSKSGTSAKLSNSGVEYRTRLAPRANHGGLSCSISARTTIEPQA